MRLYLQAQASKFSPVHTCQEWNSPFTNERRGETALLRTRRTRSVLGARRFASSRSGVPKGLLLQKDTGQSRGICLRPSCRMLDGKDFETTGPASSFMSSPNYGLLGDDNNRSPATSLFHSTRALRGRDDLLSAVPTP